VTKTFAGAWFEDVWSPSSGRPQCHRRSRRCAAGTRRPRVPACPVPGELAARGQQLRHLLGEGVHEGEALALDELLGDRLTVQGVEPGFCSRTAPADSGLPAMKRKMTLFRPAEVVPLLRAPSGLGTSPTSSARAVIEQRRQGHSAQPPGRKSRKKCRRVLPQEVVVPHGPPSPLPVTRG